MRYARGSTLVVLAAALVLCASITASNATSWSSFLPGTFSDISLTPPLAGGTSFYTLVLGDNPTVTIGSETYDISWVSAFYAVGDTSSTTFTATQGASSLGWRWDAKANNGQIAGWFSDGQGRLYAGDEVTFQFGQLIAAPDSLVLGLHIGYTTPAGFVTDGRRGDIEIPPPPQPQVPEMPASALALLGGLLVPATTALRARLARR